MIEYIHGDLTELTPALAIVETAGWDYGAQYIAQYIYCHSGQTGSETLCSRSAGGWWKR